MNDLIDRQAVLDIFKPWLDVKGYSEGELNMLRAVIYELETMPSTSAWVSVKDRLPEPFTVVLARYTDGGIRKVAYNNEFIGFITNATVTHWMPLPEPPESNEPKDKVADCKFWYQKYYSLYLPLLGLRDKIEQAKFFNQRAGRELWSEKPKDVQDRDIASSERLYDALLSLIKESDAE